jgi:hypothetical protein
MSNQLSMFSLEELPVKHSQSLDLEEDYLTNVLTSPLSIAEYLLINSQNGSFGKTYRASLVLSQMQRVVTLLEGMEENEEAETISHKVAILQPCLQRFGNAGILALGVCLTLDISECHSDAVGSLLSDILEVTGDHLLRYCLSVKACEGILRRAAARGKELPKELKEVLEWVVSTASQTE